jgi:Predicted metal-dependent phosphoesterases (PHP family)
MNTPQSKSPEVVELCGAIHLHTTYSDGSVDFPALIAYAKEVGLDFIVVTDHLSLKGREAGYEGFSDDLFVVVGYEHNDINNLNHYLALGTDNVVRIHDKPQKYIDAIKKNGGIGFIAHPVEKRHYFKDYPAYPWNDWTVHGFDGIELWNQMSDWLEKLKSWLNFFRLFYPRRFLVSAEKEILQRWDEYNRVVFKSGIGGVDAHTMKIKFGLLQLTIFPIKVELKGIRTHVYLPGPLPRNDIDRSKELFLDALKNGMGFITNFRRGNAKGTRIFIKYSNGIASFPGPQSPAGILPATLCVQLVDKAEIRLIKNGEIIQKSLGQCGEFVIADNGLYRIEVYKGRNAWIYSNPFPVGTYPLW